MSRFYFYFFSTCQLFFLDIFFFSDICLLQIMNEISFHLIHSFFICIVSKIYRYITDTHWRLYSAIISSACVGRISSHQTGLIKHISLFYYILGITRIFFLCKPFLCRLVSSSGYTLSNTFE